MTIMTPSSESRRDDNNVRVKEMTKGLEFRLGISPTDLI